MAPIGFMFSVIFPVNLVVLAVVLDWIYSNLCLLSMFLWVLPYFDFTALFKGTLQTNLDWIGIFLDQQKVFYSWQSRKGFETAFFSDFLFDVWGDLDLTSVSLKSWLYGPIEAGSHSINCYGCLYNGQFG